MRKKILQVILLTVLMMAMSITAFAANPNYQYLYSEDSGMNYIDVANTHLDPNNPDIAYVKIAYAGGSSEGVLHTTWIIDYKNMTKSMSSMIFVAKNGKTINVPQNPNNKVKFKNSKEENTFDMAIAKYFGRSLSANIDNNPTSIEQPNNNQVNNTQYNNTGEKRLGVSLYISKDINAEAAQQIRTAIMNSYRQYLNTGFTVIEGDEIDNALKNAAASVYEYKRNSPSNTISLDNVIAWVYSDPFQVVNESPLGMQSEYKRALNRFNLDHLLLFYASPNTNGTYDIRAMGVGTRKWSAELAYNSYHKGLIDEIVKASFHDFLNRPDRSPGDPVDMILRHENENKEGVYYRGTLSE